MRNCTRYLLALFFLFMNLLVVGQSSEIEDLQQRLENHPKQDAIRLNLLLSLSTKIGANNTEEMIRCGQEALAISEAIDSSSGLAKSYTLIGLGFQYSAENDSALIYYERALQSYLELDDENNYGEVLSKMGMLCAMQTDFGMAIEHLNVALEIGERLGDQVLLMKANNNVGEVHMAQLLYDEALEFYGKAVELAQNLEDTFSLATIYKNIGGIHYQLANDNEAYRSYKKALNFHRSGAIDDPRTRLYLLVGIGNVATYLEKYKEALSVFREAEDIAQQTNLPRALINIYVSFSHCYKTMGDNSGKKTYYDQSLYYSKKGLLIAQETNLAQEEYQALIGMTNIYESIGDFENAYKISKLRVALKDSLFNETKAAQFAEIKTKYETERKEKENILLQKENLENEAIIGEQKRWVLSLGAGGVLLAILVLISYRFYKSTSKQKGVIEKQANKLQALDAFKSRFFANVSHDLRTPLTLIQGHIFHIKNEENYLNTKSEDSLRKLEINTGKLIQLTDEIKDLILLEDDKLKLNYSSIEINPYLERVVNLFSSAAAIRRVSLNFVSSIEDQLMIHVDPLQLEKIIYNLLSNAFKFTQSGGNIIISLHQEDENAIIRVEDNGAGISEDKVSHIFDRYYQASENVHSTDEGIGIGLALVLELVELHGGNIQVESKLGMGTKFIVSLPLNLDKKCSENAVDVRYIQDNKALLLDGETGGEDGVSIDVDEEIKRGKNVPTVLIVDDHPDIRNYIKELIDDQYIIRQAGNGKEALNTLSKEKVDIVITDLMMPWMDGHGLIEEMKKQENLKNIPVLVVSARTTEEDKLKVLEQGVNDFLAKPFQPNELKLRISNALTKKNSGISIWDTVAKDKKKLNDIEKNIITQVNNVILSKINDSSLSVQDLADEMVASRRNAFRMINELTQMNPKDYIKHIRFQYVEDLMKKGKVKSLTEAAHAIGMSNPTHFGKNFETKMGVHPSVLLIS